MHPLDGIRAKIDRGEEHLNAIPEELGLVFAENAKPVDVSAKIDMNKHELRVTVSRVDDAPSRLSLIVGDVVHNFRSALDHLVFALAFVDSWGKEFDGTAFPCSLTRDNFNGTYVQGRLLQGLTKEHRAKLARHQPYRGGKWNSPHPAQVLNDFWNDDKHRLLQPIFWASLETKIRLFNFHDCDTVSLGATGQAVAMRPLEPGAVLLKYPVAITGPHPKVDVHFDVGLTICLRNGLFVEGALKQILDFCRTVVEDFRGDFTTPKARRVLARPMVGRFLPLTAPSVEALQGSIVPGGAFIRQPKHEHTSPHTQP